MDFSIFNRKKQLNEFCEVIVVDFVNKTEVCRHKINNLLPMTPEVEKDLKNAQSQVAKIREEFIKNAQEQDNTSQEGKHGVGA